MMTPTVIDIYHGDRVLGERFGGGYGGLTGFKALAAAGFKGVILKASQTSDDPAYFGRRQALTATTLRQGAYHFNTNEPVTTQLDRFFRCADPDQNTRMCLDWEPQTGDHGRMLPPRQQMQLSAALDFLHSGSQRLGRRMTVYGGSLIKQLIIGASQEQRDELALYPLWLSEYGLTAKMIDFNGHPLPWKTWDLWQRDADGLGPDYHNVPGIMTKNIDQSVYARTDEEFQATWAGTPI